MEKQNTWPWILGGFALLSTICFSAVFFAVRNNGDVMTVTGSANAVVTSDTAKWTGSFTRNVTIDQLKSGYDMMDKDLKAVIKFFKDAGIEKKDVIISPVFIQKEYSYSSGQPDKYSISQNVEVQSSDINKITNIANNTRALIDAGVIFSPYPVEYFYTKLSEKRLELLSEAVKDARLRADKIAESGNKKVDELSSVSVGVTQVLSLNSVEISDYGAYDTSKIEKEISLTVKGTFKLK